MLCRSHYSLVSRSLYRAFAARRSLSAMTSPPRLDNVSLSIDSNAIAILKYNRPKAANALNTATLKDILSGLQWAESSNDIRIVVTTGEGKFYTAGASTAAIRSLRELDLELTHSPKGLDLLDKTNQGPNSTISDEFIDTLSQIHESLIKTDKLIISAVNGPAPGWGTSSLSLSDLVYATPEATFFTPFAQWGLCAEGCSSLTFARIMGRQKASALILAGERMSAAELEAAGLVTKVLAREGFLEAVLGVARRTAALPAEALRASKRLMMRTLRAELLEANAVECEQLRAQARGAESREAIESFAREQERRKKEKAAKL